MHGAFGEAGRLHGPRDPAIDIDVDIVFEMMRDAYTSDQMNKVVLVSGDGDYFRTVDYLIGIGKFEKLLMPSRKNASSPYKRLPESAKAWLDTSSMRKKIGKAQRELA